MFFCLFFRLGGFLFFDDAGQIQGTQNTEVIVAGIVVLRQEYQPDVGVGHRGLGGLGTDIAGAYIFQIQAAAAFLQGEGGAVHTEGQGEGGFCGGGEQLLGGLIQSLVFVAVEGVLLTGGETEVRQNHFLEALVLQLLDDGGDPADGGVAVGFIQ